MLIAIEQDIGICEKIGEGDAFLKKFLEDAVKVSRDEDLLESYNKVEADKQLAAESGIKQGIAQNRREVALDMLKDNEPMEKIIKYSKLALKDIEEIKKNLNA